MMAIRTPTSYTDALAQADELIREIASAKDRFSRGDQQRADALTIISRIPMTGENNGYATWAAYVDAQVAANPSDEQWQLLAAQKAKIFADYAVDKALMEAKIAASDAAT